jgi:hypothetical protein
VQSGFSCPAAPKVGGKTSEKNCAEKYLLTSGKKW